jgi:ribosomal protein S17
MTVLEGIVTKAGVMGKTVTVTVRRDSIKPLIWTMES